MRMNLVTSSHLLLRGLIKVFLGVFFSLFFSGCAQGPSGISWGSLSANSAVSPTGGGSGPTNILINADETAALAIITQYCTSCHTSSSGPYNVYNLTDVNHLQSSGLIVAGAPGQSLLFNVVAGGTMPPGAPLPSSVVTTLSSWISGN